MLESMLSLCLNEVQFAQAGGSPVRMFGPTRTADGYVMAAVASEKSFVTLCEAANSSDVYSVLPPAVTVSLWRNASTALLRLTVSVPSVSTACVIAAIVELPAAVVMFRLATFAKFHKK